MLSSTSSMQQLTAEHLWEASGFKPPTFNTCLDVFPLSMPFLDPRTYKIHFFHERTTWPCQMSFTLCSFRPIPCPAAQCNAEVCYQQLLEHILKQCRHSWPGISTVDATNEITFDYIIPEVFKEDSASKVVINFWKNRHFF